MKKITCGIALIAALTLLGAPLAAHATEETEVASSESTPTTLTTPPLTEPTTGTSPTSQETTALTPTIPTVETDTQLGELPVETPQPIVSEATSPTTVAPSSTSSTPPTTSPKYILAVWENEAGSPKFPQSLVTSYPTDSTNVDVLSKYAVKCGTFYQSDLYANDERTAALIAGGVLNGGMESWPDGGTQRYDTFTTDPCPVYEPPVLNCPEGTVPGVINEHGDPTSCVNNEPNPGEEPSSPSTPPIPAGPTTPDAPGTGSTDGGTAPLPTSTEVTPLAAPSVAPSLHTALEATGTTEVLPTAKPATHSLAYTGSDNNFGAGLALVVILAGLLIVVLSRNRRP